MEDIIIVEDLRKIHGKDILAVDGISFKVHKGEVFGFLGPSGHRKEYHDQDPHDPAGKDLRKGHNRWS
jgi:ABC-type lipopolysaccharide export system ATPase subunit